MASAFWNRAALRTPRPECCYAQPSTAGVLAPSSKIDPEIFAADPVKNIDQWQVRATSQPQIDVFVTDAPETSADWEFLWLFD